MAVTRDTTRTTNLQIKLLTDDIAKLAEEYDGLVKRITPVIVPIRDGMGYDVVVEFEPATSTTGRLATLKKLYVDVAKLYDKQSRELQLLITETIIGVSRKKANATPGFAYRDLIYCVSSGCCALVMSSVRSSKNKWGRVGRLGPLLNKTEVVAFFKEYDKNRGC